MGENSGSLRYEYGENLADCQQVVSNSLADCYLKSANSQGTKSDLGGGISFFKVRNGRGSLRACLGD